MHASSVFGLPMPDDTDPLSGVAQAIRDLVEDLEVKFDGLAVPSGDLYTAVSSDWTVTTCDTYLYPGDLLRVDLTMSRDSGGTLTAGSNGNLTPSETLLTFKSAYRPSVRAQWIPAHVTGVSSWTVRVPSSGVAQITDGNANATIAVGDSLRIQGLVVVK